MRKTINKWAVMIVLAIFLTLSVGYALFSDTITIEGTATAQGNFDMTATCIAGLESNLDNMFGLSEGENGYKNDSCTVSDNKVTMSVELEQPGAARYFTVDIKNTGSIDAAVEINSDGFILDDNATSTLKVTNTSTNEVTEYNYNGNEQYDDSFGGEFPAFLYVINIIKLEDGSYIIDDADYMARVYKDGNGKRYFKLSPNETITVVYSSEWSESSTVQGYISETKYTMPINFKQFTSDLELDTTFEPCIFGC